MDEITENMTEGRFKTMGTYCGFPSEMTWAKPEREIPCIIWIESGGQQPRDNHPRIKFAADKTWQSLSKAPDDLPLIPLMICDDPYIPASYSGVDYTKAPHNLTEDEFGMLKNFVKTHKEALLDCAEGKTCFLGFMKSIGYYAP